MQCYIEQLLEILHKAQRNRLSARYLELPGEMEGMRDVIEVEKSLDENEHRLSDKQVRLLIDGIRELWHVFHYEADFRKGEFDERRQYTKLEEKWKEHVPVFRGFNGTWHIEMYDYYKDQKK